MSHTIFFILCVAILATGMLFAAYGQQAPAPAAQAPTPQSPSPAAQPPAATANQEPANPRPQTSVPSAAEPKNLSEDAWMLLMAGRSSDKSRDRSDAISALSILDREPKAITLIDSALEDKDESIRLIAATSLGTMKARSAIPKLTDALDDSSAEVSFATAQALWKMGDRSGAEILYEVLDGERKAKPGVIQSKLRKAKADMHDPKALALIGINQASGAFLGPFSMGVSFIEEYAKNNSAPIQSLCAQLLSSDNSPRTIQELTDALDDKNWAVRAEAVRALARLNHPQAIPQLKDMMKNDKDQAVRFSAAAAIIRLGRHARTTKSAVPSTPKPLVRAILPIRERIVGVPSR
jgi:HEAT repeat protein